MSETVVDIDTILLIEVMIVSLPRGPLKARAWLWITVVMDSTV